MIVVECIPESILDHGINHCRIAHTVAVTCLRDCVRSHGHVLHTTGNHDVSVACHNHLGSLVYTVQTGTADNVHGNSGNLDGKTCLDGCLTSYVLALACLNNAAHVNLIYILRLNACSVQSFLDDDSAQLSCGGSAQCASHGTDCGTACSG